MRLAHVERVVDQVVVDRHSPHALLVRLEGVANRLAEVCKPPQHLHEAHVCLTDEHTEMLQLHSSNCIGATAADDHFCAVQQQLPGLHILVVLSGSGLAGCIQCRCL